MAKKEQALTLRQKIFCEEYLANGRVGTAAAKAAGYSLRSANTQASNLLTFDHIKNYIAEKEKDFVKTTHIDYAYKIRKLANVVQTYLPQDNTPIDSDPIKARIVLEYIKVAIAAIQEMNRMQGDYAAEKRVNANFNLDADMEKLKQVMDDLLAKYRREY
jgi:hypothetical protein